MTAPRISVVVPTYRRPSFLREAVESVLAQSFEDLECIVVDDGSGDDTASVVSAIASEDPRLRLVELQHRGRPGRSRNAGIAVGRGELVAFVDDDDLWLPNKLERQLHWLERHAEHALVCARIEEFGDRAATWPKGEMPATLSLEILARGNRVATSTVLVRRSVLHSAGGFDESLTCAQDYDLWLRLARTHQLGFMNEVLCRYRVHATNISADRTVALECLERTLRRSFDAGDLSGRDFRKRLREIHAERASLGRGREKLYWLVRRQLAHVVPH